MWFSQVLAMHIVFFLLMSLLPLINAGLVGCCLVSVLLWKLSIFFFFLSCLLYLSFNVYRQSLDNLTFYGYAFGLFLLTEVLAFGTLFFCCLSYEPYNELDSMSESLGLPLLGSFVLLGSSITVTTYHHFYGMPGCSIWLFFTVILGSGFLGVQFLELWGSDIMWVDSYYYSCCFSVVGLHFMHVSLGILGLIYVLLSSFIPGYYNKHNHFYYATLIAWYWHFVDYVWLYVYVIVYWI